AAAIPGLEADLTGLNLRRLQGFLGLPDVADRGEFGDSGDEPVALGGAAEKLPLLAIGIAGHKERVAGGRLHVKHGDFRGILGVEEDVEDFLAVVVFEDVEDRRALVKGLDAEIAYLDMGTDALELLVKGCEVHAVSSCWSFLKDNPWPV